MSRQVSSGRLGRLCSALAGSQQRKLFLTVFLWTCLCLVIFKSSLFRQAGPPDERPLANFKRAADTSSSRAPSFVPELALPDNGNSNALIYSLSYQLPQSSSLSSLKGADGSPAPAQEPQSAANQIPSDIAARLAGTAPSESRAPAAASSQQQPRAAQPAKLSQPLVGELVPGAECNYEYPNLLDLQFNNIHWQRLTSSRNVSNPANYYLYNAYYDDRWRAGPPSVRVLAMIDRVEPPPTNCLLWSDKLRQGTRLVPLVVRATFVYAWYPKWGNYKDGFLQPWIVTCSLGRHHPPLVPTSVTLVEVPEELGARERRDTSTSTEAQAGAQPAPMALPPSFSSSSPAASPLAGPPPPNESAPANLPRPLYDCSTVGRLTNNLPVYNQRPPVKQKFAVCVKGLDFPHEDVSVRLVEWIELLNLLGAGKIFLYNLDIHENISKVLHYYQKRGIVELSPLTLPGDQPNLPEYQHMYLKSKLTTKRQNELIPYNDCLYRNLNSYQYLALLDIDEIIMPLKHHNWYDLMQEVETLSLSEQNYSRASYNVRNVYFFDDLAGPLGTTSSSTSSSSSSSSSNSDSQDPDQDPDDDSKPEQPESGAHESDSLERGIPHYLHMMQHVYRSKNYTKPGQYVKCFHNTDRVVSLHNHFPMNCFGQCTTYSIPVHLAHLQHYRKDCVGPLKQSCKSDFRVYTTRDTTIWKYKQQMIRRTTRVLSHLGLLATPNQHSEVHK